MTNGGIRQEKESLTRKFGPILPTVIFAVRDRALCISFAVFYDCGIFAG